jgi:hypothetical protein
MTREERRSITAARIAVGRLPQPRWVTVTPGVPITGLCDGCGESIVPSDSAFKVVLQQAIRLKFHDECFDVYTTAPPTIIGLACLRASKDHRTIAQAFRA